MTARITAAEARAMGLDVSKPARVRTTRKEAKGPYHTRCCACGEEFTARTTETKHVEEVRHYRYETVIEREEPNEASRVRG